MKWSVGLNTAESLRWRTRRGLWVWPPGDQWGTGQLQGSERNGDGSCGPLFWEIMSWRKVVEWKMVSERVFLSKREQFMPGFQDSKSPFTLYFKRNISGIVSFERIKNPLMNRLLEPNLFVKNFSKWFSVTKPKEEFKAFWQVFIFL